MGELLKVEFKRCKVWVAFFIVANQHRSIPQFPENKSYFLAKSGVSSAGYSENVLKVSNITLLLLKRLTDFTRGVPLMRRRRFGRTNSSTIPTHC